MHSVEDLVERVLGASPLPCDDNDVNLLLVGLHRHLPHVEQLLDNRAPDLVSQARRIREEPVPEEGMPLVILTIRLAEIAHALIDALPANAMVHGCGNRPEGQFSMRAAHRRGCLRVEVEDPSAEPPQPGTSCRPGTLSVRRRPLPREAVTS
ncbi:hypothetical protein KBZ00_17455 [Streptomyces sp. RK31]|uniref:hypothetical protein n=1 Tax=Streptomyces sp. RK31 TaxID=2824892 RepID=UPI001B37030C|nr:hypothetical protein [Streptomyces sp. RK31]MBQ0972912.1 hypothetical protein [Streptomyces sp. RK31]